VCEVRKYIQVIQVFKDYLVIRTTELHLVEDFEALSSRVMYSSENPARFTPVCRPLRTRNS